VVAAGADSAANDDARNDDASVEDPTLRVTLLEQAHDVAPGFEAPFRGAIRAALEERGIDVRTNATVERATESAVELERGGSIEHDLLVWTGGIAGQDALDGDRPVVDDRLLLGDRTFGLGDAVRAIDRDGAAVPATAQAAVRQAETVATNVERLLEGGDTFEPRLDRFAFDPPGWVVSVGDGAVAQVGPTVVTGKAAVALKASVGVGYLSSVGALREAVDLVNQELGLAVGND
jgi:NADH dehydrogenase